MKKALLVFSAMVLAFAPNLKAQTSDDESSYDYPYLTFEGTDGTRESLDVESLEITFKDGTLIATNDGNQTGTYSVEALLKMYFDTARSLMLSSDDSSADTKNSTIITRYANETAHVTINGYTLYKDGDWNSICLPFDVDLSNEESPLYGAYAYTLSSASLSDKILTLNFTSATSLTAGTPYIIKWDASDTNISSPTFETVILKDENNPTSGENVSFEGIYSSAEVSTSDAASLLYLASSNQLKNPTAGSWLKPFHSYFKVDDINAAQQYSLNIDGESTGIQSIGRIQTTDGSIYRIDGVKVDGHYIKGGLYIENGHKVIKK